MNSGGPPNCRVCREAGVLLIYSYVSPIDEAAPAEAAVVIPPGGSREFSVVPIGAEAPPAVGRLVAQETSRRRRSEVRRRGPRRRGRAAADGRRPRGPRDRARALGRRLDARRRARPRAPRRPVAAGRPAGRAPRRHREEGRGRAGALSVVLSGASLGRYRLTAQVRDDARIPGAKHPWVLRDPDKILEERREWLVTVGD